MPLVVVGLAACEAPGVPPVPELVPRPAATVASSPAEAEADPCAVPGAICTWMGSPDVAGFGEEGTHRLDTSLSYPQDLVFAPDGTAFVSDANNQRVLRVDPDGTTKIVAGTGMLGDGPNTDGSANDCWAGCVATDSALHSPAGLAVHPDDPDVLWIAAFGNDRVLLLDVPRDTLWWWTGTGRATYAPGFRDEAALYLPASLVVDPATGDLYVADEGNHLLRAVSTDGQLRDVAGRPRVPGFAGDGCDASLALLHGPTDRNPDPAMGLALMDRVLFFTDPENGVVRAIDLDTGIVGTVAGRRDPLGTGTYTDPATGVQMQADLGSAPGYAGDGGEARDALFARPSHVAVGPDGTLFVSDTGNGCVRAVDPQTRVIRTAAGVCGGAWSPLSGLGGPATDAVLGYPMGLAVDGAGHLYVVDMANHVILRVTAERTRDGGEERPPPTVLRPDPAPDPDACRGS